MQKIHGSPPVELRLAANRHAEIISQMARDLVERGLPWTWNAKRVRRQIQDGSTNVLMAMQGGAVVGFAIANFGFENVHLNLLAVRPDNRRMGTATNLISWQEHVAIEGGLRAIELEVRANNLEAQEFYRRCGYEPVDRLAKYYNGQEDAVRMKHWLQSPDR